MEQGLARVLERFREISAVPRCSGQESGARELVERWASGLSFDAAVDGAGNLLVRVPPPAGGSRRPASAQPNTVVLQGHLDMVCEKEQGWAHDFTRDPIEPRLQGEWMHAAGTTLGADNGIGVALAMEAAEHAAPRPPLELLFTVGEEVGLTGAAALDPAALTGRMLLNLDSEHDGVLTVGCAGGEDCVLSFPAPREPLGPGMRILRLQAGGLVGGHSGVDINAGRANANLLVARTLRRLLGCLDLALLAIHGGSAPNAIPRDAQALLAVPPDAVERAEAMVSELQEAARREYRGVEERLALTIAPAPEQPVASALASASARRLVDLLLELPNGVASMSTEFPGTVQTSNNLGVLRSLESSIQIVSSQRSSSAQELASLTNRIEQAATLAGASSTTGTSYPPWRPRLDSPLLGRCREVWRARHGRDPEVRVIHAGLECAVIGMRCPGMDMVSFGPTIEDAHSPRERLSIPSLAAVQRYLSDLLASLAS